MRFSDTIITSENIEKEVSGICNLLGMSTLDFDSVSSILEDTYISIKPNKTNSDHAFDFSEHVLSHGVHKVSSGFVQRCKVAYEFGNGFMIFNLERTW
jgi:hypothetical protein